MTQIEKNKEELLNEIEKYSMRPMTPAIAERLSAYLGAYHALCEIEEEAHGSSGYSRQPRKIGYDMGDGAEMYSRTGVTGYYGGDDDDRSRRDRYEVNDRYDGDGRGVRNLFDGNERRGGGSMHWDDERRSEGERLPFVTPLDPHMVDDNAPLTQEVAEGWLAGIKNADGTKGAHWSLQQTNQVMAKYNLTYDPVEFWAVMNMIYSDDVAVAKRYNVNTIEYYKDRAKAWLDDADANPDKTARYFYAVVNRK